MATTTFTQVPNMANDAEFRAWIVNVRTALTALGLVRTADTGQIDPTTVARPGASTSAGYDIWRFDDTLQATKPVFIKLEYGIGANAGEWSFWITVGSSTNGAGTINSGNLTTRRQIRSGGSAVSMDSFFSGNASRLTCAMHSSTGAVGGIVDIERSKDTNGDDTNEAVVMAVSGTAGSFYAWVPFSGTVVETAAWPCLTPTTGTTAVIGANVGMFPVIPIAAGPLKQPLEGVLVYMSGDIAQGANNAVPLYGSHTYKASGQTRAALNAFATGNPTAAILWE